MTWYLVHFEDRSIRDFDTLDEALAAFNKAQDADRVVRSDGEVLVRRFAGRVAREAS